MNPNLYIIKSRCFVCGSDKILLEEEISAVCQICGQKSEIDSTCENDHYICHTCRQKAARQEIIDHCTSGKFPDPYELMIQLMKLPTVAMHGPEHHLLLTAALLTAFCFVKSRNDLSLLLEEANNRSYQVPGGVCGNWGVCGAAIGIGIFSSILLEASPYTEDVWKSCGQLTSKCASAISKQGGPRCCKRDSFIALGEAIKFSNRKFKTNFMVPENIECIFYTNNKECKGKNCRFFPQYKYRQAKHHPTD